MIQWFKNWIFGRPKSPLDPRVFHNVSLVAFFAWVGLGADGLSSSCYGPEEAFRALGQYTHLAIPLALAVAATVFILSASYSEVIEVFPNGGGGYLVAAKLIGPLPGLVSGSALLVDYILTVAISVASSIDAIFSFLPPDWAQHKFMAAAIILAILVTLNLRGVKESIVILTPIFLVFLVTHAIVILYGIFGHWTDLPGMVMDTVTETREGVGAIGLIGMGAIFLRAFALGGGTFTGIEAVSNGLQILREPRAATGKRTMKFMAWSLALTAGGILINYVLNGVHHVPGKTMNAALVGGLTSGWPFGKTFLFITLLSEGALLLVAAQAGFLDGPRTMSNMAIDSWLPRRFTNLSDRLVIKDGVLVIGVSALAAMFYTGGSVSKLVVMYSINVFLTFSLTQFGMVKHFSITRPSGWPRKLVVSLLGLILTVGILVATSVIKFMDGGWVTLVITGALVVFCHWVHSHYKDTTRALHHLDEILVNLTAPETPPAVRKQGQKPAAILMVNGYNGMGIHSFLSIHRLFPGHFKNFVFLSVGVIDSDRFKGTAELENLEKNVRTDLDKYVELANSMGLYAEGHMVLETDVIDGLDRLCEQISPGWAKKVFFMGQLAFEGETFWTRFLHNRTSFVLQRRLLFNGHQAVILPIRVRLKPAALPK
ncbi:MAG: amino acid permease [Elusimicrobia bacterium]|jgi:amino acid transporter|nr:amino acid permease [Elusimicrobiota bacterium]MBK7687746.1 amino acid permease [Elusimicrobiota bacterium]MBK8423982.1 amino acid permease [Elusimicrobiota bacterium]MBK9695359.1 amino acid permease [Elusimicrobiota bacterium]MBK9921869.1 amino acid permease [Elusimicrobiota bacterium]